MVTALIVGLVPVALFAGIYVAARRFEARQRALGRWDQYGPLEETEPPPEIGPRWGMTSWRWGNRTMSERLEVIGKWKGRVLRRRRPNEKPE